ncbi:MAG: hypothetical protein GY765_07830, partial [bacterium]|nr:hypothetical protein [bacterium]
MKRITILILVICCLPRFGQAEIVELKKHGNSIKDLIPASWKILSNSFGDLNKDGIEDLVFVIQSTDPIKIELNKGLGTPTID